MENTITIAKKEIVEAASAAVTLIANAAKEAASLLSSNAADALKVVNSHNAGDHDLLITLKVTMEGIAKDIKQMQESVHTSFGSHEHRINALENKNSEAKGKSGITIPLVIALSTGGGGLLVWIIELLIKK